MIKRLFLTVLFLTVLFLFSISVSQGYSNSDSPIAVMGGQIIDGSGEDPLENGLVIIEKDRIKSISKWKKGNIPTTAKLIDVKGATIMPGIINAHVHRCYRESHLKPLLQGGVTTVRDLGGEPQFSIRDLQLKDSTNARLVAAGQMVTAPGGYPSGAIGLEVSSPRDAEQKITRLIDNGADLIKIVFENNLQGRVWPVLPIEVARSIIKTAHSKNRLVSAHAMRVENIELAIDAGVDDVAHMVFDPIPDEYINQMIEKNIYWVPTLELYNGAIIMGKIPDMKTPLSNLRRFVAAGGKVALGTDFAGYITQFDLGMPITEMTLMEKAGMTPEQIIVAGTKNAAKVCGLEKEIGTLSQGKIADLIAVNGNPLKNIQVMEKVRMVIHNGEIVKNDFE